MTERVASCGATGGQSTSSPERMFNGFRREAQKVPRCGKLCQAVEEEIPGGDGSMNKSRSSESSWSGIRFQFRGDGR